MAQMNWSSVRDCAQTVLGLDSENADALAFLESADRVLHDQPSDRAREILNTAPTDQPTSFANGRYEVKRFQGEGGKKKVYLAHDTLLDRDVAFALIKTEGLDEASRTRITREAQPQRDSIHHCTVEIRVVVKAA